MALNWDNVTSVIQKNYIPVVFDQVTNSSFLMSKMKAKPDVLTGGTSIQVPLRYALYTVEGYAKYGIYDVRPKEIRTATVYDWRYLTTNVTIAKQDEDMADGDRAVVNIIQDSMEVLKLSLTDALSTYLYNAGTDSYIPHGLRHIVNYDRTLGDIDSTSYTWWDAIVAADFNSNYTTTNLSAANLVDPTSNYYLPEVMKKTWMRTIHNGEKPDMVLASRGMFELYEQVAQPQVNYPFTPGIKAAADLGFESLNYKGVPLIYDEYCPAGYMFFINSKYVDMKILNKDNFKMGDWQKPVNQHAKMAQLTVTCNFTCSNPRHEGALQAVSTIG